MQRPGCRSPKIGAAEERKGAGKPWEAGGDCQSDRRGESNSASRYGGNVGRARGEGEGGEEEEEKKRRGKWDGGKVRSPRGGETRGGAGRGKLGFAPGGCAERGRRSKPLCDAGRCKGPKEEEERRRQGALLTEASTHPAARGQRFVSGGKEDDVEAWTSGGLVEIRAQGTVSAQTSGWRGGATGGRRRPENGKGRRPPHVESSSGLRLEARAAFRQKVPAVLSTGQAEHDACMARRPRLWSRGRRRSPAGGCGPKRRRGERSGRETAERRDEGEGEVAPKKAKKRQQRKTRGKETGREGNCGIGAERKGDWALGAAREGGDGGRE